MSEPSSGRRVRWSLVLLGAVAALVGLTVRAAGEEEPKKAADPFESPYRNTRPDVKYVGVEVCASCHEAQYASYRRTPHSRAFRPAEVGKEPWPGSVHHAKSGLDYEMVEVDGRLRIRELVRLGRGDEHVLSDRAVDYVVGSGTSSLTYLARDGDFLLESPTTWFTRKDAWGMSPGYDMPQHNGFSRVVSRQCLTCHVGRVDAIDGSDFRLALGEGAIGCERCHGPGEAHVAWHRAHKHEKGTADPTIVVPTKLSRDLADDVCGQCHLDDTTVVKRPGIDYQEWRPGLPAERFRIHYGPKTPSPLMRVVGHMDQMRASRCYQESGTMTCLTCHDPHGRPLPEDRAETYRRRCLTCHEVDACKLAGEARRKQQPDDSCVACHMPTVKTDIVHFAFTHHRVGVHGKGEETAQEAPAALELVATDDVSGLPEAERDRDLGLAYWQCRRLTTGDTDAPFLPLPVVHDFVRKAQRLLRSAYRAGQRDPRLLVALAEMASQPAPPEPGVQGPQTLDIPAAFRLLDEAFAHGADMPFATRIVGLQLKAMLLVQGGRLEEARPVIEELTRLRHEASDWGMLSEIHWIAGRKDEALKALEKLVAYRAHDPMVHDRVGQILSDAGRKAEGALHQRIAVHLLRAMDGLPPVPEAPKDEPGK